MSFGQDDYDCGIFGIFDGTIKEKCYQLKFDDDFGKNIGIHGGKLVLCSVRAKNGLLCLGIS